eukprot:8943491-Lingulodinium_polyedra.AAC.1
MTRRRSRRRLGLPRRRRPARRAQAPRMPCLGRATSATTRRRARAAGLGRARGTSGPELARPPRPPGSGVRAAEGARTPRSRIFRRAGATRWAQPRRTC